MYQRYKDGWLETISGCMFAGKTEELIRRITILQYARKNIMVFKPAIDDRYSTTSIVSHAGGSIDCYVVSSSAELYDMVKSDCEVVAIDEVQFFDEGICDVCEKLAMEGKRVMAAGLDTDFRGEPFGPMPKLMAQAEFTTKLAAVCSKCGAPATRTQRIINGKAANWHDPVIMVGASESYEARCRHCHEVPGKKIKIR